MIYFLESYYVLNNGWKKTTKKATYKKTTVPLRPISAFKCIVKILESFLLRNKCFVKV